MALDWLKKKFGKRQTVADVISAYGELLEKYPLSIVDISMLPIPKTQMKVLLKGLYAKVHNKEQKTVFENGFMFPSQFQDGVGANPIDDPTSMLPGDLEAVSDTDIERLGRWIAWKKLSLAEMEILLAEWKRFKEG